MNRFGSSCITLPEGVAAGEVSDGYHTFNELYAHRIANFLALMAMADRTGLDVGWSRNHADGNPCFGGGWVIAWITAPSGKQARYHMEDTRSLQLHLEQPLGSPWNEKEETIDALREIAL